MHHDRVPQRVRTAIAGRGMSPVRVFLLTPFAFGFILLGLIGAFGLLLLERFTESTVDPHR